ncbi:MAG: DUF1295 domain-containing protein [Bacteroidales bacterium]|nr:DUF1295 domain-containing protein [Bacteroidales bacterium]
MLTLFLQALPIIIVLVTILWIVSIFIKNVSIIDLFWGVGFVIVNTYYFFMSGEMHTRKILLLVLVAIWGLRLSIYLTWRNAGKGEDYRYQEFRRNFGEKRYWWYSYFQVFLLQGALIMLVSLPLLAAHVYTDSNGLNWLDYAALAVWTIGFIFEAGGDLQLALFKRKPENRGKVYSSGLWKYTRHPNYFGDSAVWWSYALFCIAAGSYWPVIGSVLMTLLIIKVSGVALLDRSMPERRPEYADYIGKTSAFIPWFPKKSTTADKHSKK